MKKLIYLSVILLSFTDIYSQIFSTECLKAGIFLPSMPACKNGDYYLAFEDNFDGDVLDLTKWNPVEGVPRDFNFSNSKVWHLPENLTVSNGTLKITAKKLVTPYTGTLTDWSTNPPTTQTSTFDYTTGELWSKQKFHYGKYEIRCRLPNGKGFFPAFWMFGGQRWNEIDVFDNIDGNDRFCCGPGYDFDGVGESYGCRWSTDNIPDLSQWHTFTCIFDFDRIVWQIDGSTVRTLYRFSTISGKYITCGEDIAIGTYFQEKSFPVEDMHIIMNLAIRSGDKAPDANTVFPNYYEVDYVRFYIKSACVGCLDYIVYENTNQLPTTTRASNYIQAGNNVEVNNGQDISFKAPIIKLSSGFSVKQGANFKAIAEDCNLMNYEDIPINFIGTNAINNYEIIKCINSIYSIEATGVLFYSFTVYNSLGQLIYSTSGTPTSNHINLWNAINAANAWYSVHLELENCSNSDVRDSNLLITQGNCQKSNPLDSADTDGEIINEEKIEDAATMTLNKEFRIYPNPANKEVNVFYSANISSSALITIVDINGKELFREQKENRIGTNRKVIDVSQFLNGTYILTIVSNDEKIEGKFIILK